MKGGFYGLRAKELSLITIALMCTTFFIWAWQKTALLTSLMPPQPLLKLSPDIIVGKPLPSLVSPESLIYMGKNVSLVAEKVILNNQEELPLNEAAPLSSAQRSNQRSVISSNSVTTTDQNIEIHTSVSEEAKDKQNQRPETVVGTQGPSSPREVDGEHKQLVEQVLKEVEVAMAAPVSSPDTSSPVKGKDDRNLTMLTENQACNYAKGKWVPDNNRPLYSGRDCKQWLSGAWACRLTQRTDFAYEKLRWQPKNCQMEEFEGSKFLRKMQDKTLAFVGDSLGRQQFQSLMCMLTGGKERHDVIDVGQEYGLAQARGDTRPSGWVYRFLSTNTTILYYWSSSLCDVEPINKTNPNTHYAMHLDRPPAFLRQYLHKFDVLVLNTGHHWNRGKLKANKWIMHIGGVPNNDRKLAMIWKAKNFTVHSSINWVNSQLPKYPGLKAFYRTISPRHFVGGDWNTGGSCDNTTPMSVGKEVLQDESSDASAAGAAKGTGVKLLDITALSQIRDEGHISRFSLSARSGVQDCLHWCLPGVPDTWNEILFAQI
ncbi:hypothetical protein FH972_002971 [Carpinus fangiana]|uniref:Uncharacterized protein n=1 Tax=Carpinus fangiana TaxID=176857 RepID=A0A5N6QGI3_9ROSI|nr:hypothetical protein FH972_002971 [Carpinus fangiana]